MAYGNNERTTAMHYINKYNKSSVSESNKSTFCVTLHTVLKQKATL